MESTTSTRGTATPDDTTANGPSNNHGLHSQPAVRPTVSRVSLHRYPRGTRGAAAGDARRNRVGLLRVLSVRALPCPQNFETVKWCWNSRTLGFRVHENAHGLHSPLCRFHIGRRLGWERAAPIVPLSRRKYLRYDFATSNPIGLLIIITV